MLHLIPDQRATPDEWADDYMITAYNDEIKACEREIAVSRARIEELTRKRDKLMQRCDLSSS